MNSIETHSNKTLNSEDKFLKKLTAPFKLHHGGFFNNYDIHREAVVLWG